MNLRAIGYFIALKIGEIAALFLVLCGAQWIGQFVRCALGESAHPNYFLNDTSEIILFVVIFFVVGLSCLGAYEVVKLNWSWAKELANKYKP